MVWIRRGAEPITRWPQRTPAGWADGRLQQAPGGPLSYAQVAVTWPGSRGASGQSRPNVVVDGYKLLISMGHCLGSPSRHR